MNALELLYAGPTPPDLATSPWGPMVVHALDARDQIEEHLSAHRCDTLVIDLGPRGDLLSLADWPVLVRAVLETAVVVVAPEPPALEAVRLIGLGVQDVMSSREAQDPDALARTARLAAARFTQGRAMRRAHATDLATGLPNHGQLMEHMSHLLALREREPAAMALVALRLQGMATAEGRLGKEAVQVLRRKAAVRLRAALRASDVVASVAEDTFAVLLSWVDDPANGVRVADKLVATLHRPFSVAGQDVAIAVSPGVARYPEDGREAERLLGLALSQASRGSVEGRQGLAARGGGAAAANDA